MIWVNFSITDNRVEKTVEEKTGEGRYERAL